MATAEFVGRNFLITINLLALEFYQDIVTYLRSLVGCVYLVACEHIGQENKHVHIYVHYENTKRLTTARLHGAHVDKCFGSAQQNIDYVKCRDKKHRDQGVEAVLWDEFGEPKLKGGNFSVGNVKAMETPDELPCQLYNVYNKIKNKEKSDELFYKMLDDIENDNLAPINVIYFIGKPGRGKTYAYKYALRHFKKDEITKVSIQKDFFEFVGSNKDKCLVVEEFRPSQLHPSALLQFTDKYGFSCPIKGGHKYTKPECIFICSILHPKRLYQEKHYELNSQFTRRISHLFEVGPNHQVRELSLKTNDFYYTNNELNYENEFYDIFYK